MLAIGIFPALLYHIEYTQY